MKLEAKQINRLIGGFIHVPSVAVLAEVSSIDITTELEAALVNGGYNGGEVANVRSTSEIEPGLVIVNTVPPSPAPATAGLENIVIVDKLNDLSKITKLDKIVFGKLTYVDSSYILTFYTTNLGGGHELYTFTDSFNITLKVPYRFELKDLPTDVILKVKQWWLNEAAGGGGSQGEGFTDSWVEDIDAIRALIEHENKADIGCYFNKSIYQFDATSTASDDGDSVLKPDNINIADPGRWIKKLTIGEVIYINSNPTTANNLQGIPAGTMFPSPGKTMKQMWDMLLYPYIKPVFTSFKLDGNTSQILEVGQSIAIGNHNFTWVISDPSKIVTNSIEIYPSGSEFALQTGIGIGDSPKTIAFTSIVTSTVPVTKQWKIKATDTDPNTVGYPEAYCYAYWKYMIFYGESDLEILTDVDILTLRASSFADNVQFAKAQAVPYITAPLKYKYLCFPASWTNPGFTKTDVNDTNVPGIYQVGTVTIVRNGVSIAYKVWRSLEKLEGAFGLYTKN